MHNKIAQFEETARSGDAWQKSGEWAPHTVSREEAKRIAAGYIQVLRIATGRRDFKGRRGLGIGSGAGHLEAALATYGIHMVASEWNADGLRLIGTQSPELEQRQVDLLSFEDKNCWDLILCRELYPITRTNAFSQQMDVVFRLVDALRPGGVLLLVGSDVAYPHCMNYRLMLQYLKTDSRVARIFGPVLEIVAKRTGQFPMSNLSYWVLNPLFALALWVLEKIKNQPLAAIRIYSIVRAG